ncbi:guanylyl cyclase inhibitory protein-like isoform X4 [Ascaphus truei]
MIFRTLDNNGDGVVDFREYVTAISMLVQGSPEEKLKWSFRLYDKDRDGAITRAEMLEIMKFLLAIKQSGLLNLTKLPVAKQRNAVYKMTLAASINKAESLTAEECTNRLFIRLDKDQDAMISLQEFIDGSLDDDWIRDMLECDLSTVEI